MDNNDQKSLKQIIDYRIKKINELRNNGIEPFPYKFKKDYNISTVLQSEDNLKDKAITIAGRIISLRSMGKACFMNIQDETEKMQLYIKNELIGLDNYDNIVKNLDIGDIIGIEGVLFRTKTNQLSLKVSSVSLLSKSIRPLPNIKEKDDHMFFAFDDKENRYRYRYLDLIVNPKNKALFKTRSDIIYKIREILNKKDFIEVETPILQNIHGGASAKPFITHHNTLGHDFYLRIAEELYLKRLLIGGFEKIYEIGKNFRNEGIDRTHNPEFTMLELYESYSDVYDMMELTESLIKYIAEKMNIEEVLFNSHTINLQIEFKKISFIDELNKALSGKFLDLNKKEVIDLARKSGVVLDSDLSYGKIIDKLFSELVEPNLILPTFVLDYPKLISPLAKQKRDTDLEIVERFELFIGGMEFANSFSELNDPVEQRSRLQAIIDSTSKVDKEIQVVDEDFIAAMEVGMPPVGGVGIGVDRLVMLLTGQSSIRDVILFPVLRS